ncbi:MAG: hypothetical protein CL878_11035 [Dehalococcoidia bacterium]|nr:hypothetical protein [Dehalococcoidia bacterium]
MTERELRATFPRDLGDGLVLRFAQADDIDAVVAFNRRTLTDWCGPWTRDLMAGQHPATQASDFTVVEDTRGNKVVSSLCLISNTWTYGGIPFGCGQIELVGTDPGYRRRGLVRKQIDVVHALSAARGELVQAIYGIGWFYRQFGYEMALDAHGSIVLGVDATPPLPDGQEEAYHLRAAATDDLPYIRSLYDQDCERQLWAVGRTAAEWEFERNRPVSEEEPWGWSAVTIIETSAGDRAGYVLHRRKLNRGQLIVRQVSVEAGQSLLNVMPSLLRGLAQLADTMDSTGESDDRTLRRVAFFLGRDHAAYQALPPQASRPRQPGARYVRVPEMVAFLRHIRPALERNLLGTVAEGYTGELRVGFYSHGVKLNFERGRLEAIDEAGDPWAWIEGDSWVWCNFPDRTFLQLLCGRRTVAELQESFPDCEASDTAPVLLDCLFPQFTGNLWPLM